MEMDGRHRRNGLTREDAQVEKVHQTRRPHLEVGEDEEEEVIVRLRLYLSGRGAGSGFGEGYRCSAFKKSL